MAKRKGSRWPKECPVFEVVEGGTATIAGAVVEAVEVPGPIVSSEGAELTVLQSGWLGLRVVDHSPLYPDEFKNSADRLGFPAFQQSVKQLRPLTPAAREMLALVKP
jgi:hypothetical protein